MCDSVSVCVCVYVHMKHCLIIIGVQFHDLFNNFFAALSDKHTFNIDLSKVSDGILGELRSTCAKNEVTKILHFLSQMTLTCQC